MSPNDFLLFWSDCYCVYIVKGWEIARGSENFYNSRLSQCVNISFFFALEISGLEVIQYCFEIPFLCNSQVYYQQLGNSPSNFDFFNDFVKGKNFTCLRNEVKSKLSHKEIEKILGTDWYLGIHDIWSNRRGNWKQQVCFFVVMQFLNKEIRFLWNFLAQGDRSDLFKRISLFRRNFLLSHW